MERWKLIRKYSGKPDSNNIESSRWPAVFACSGKIYRVHWHLKWLTQFIATEAFQSQSSFCQMHGVFTPCTWGSELWFRKPCAAINSICHLFSMGEGCLADKPFPETLHLSDPHTKPSPLPAFILWKRCTWALTHCAERQSVQEQTDMAPNSSWWECTEEVPAWTLPLHVCITQMTQEAWRRANIHMPTLHPHSGSQHRAQTWTGTSYFSPLNGKRYSRQSHSSHFVILKGCVW